MQSLEQVIDLLFDTLNLDRQRIRLDAGSALLGAVPELDSMAVLHVIAALEDRLGISVDDDEIDAALFETVGSLAAFVARKRGQPA